MIWSFIKVALFVALAALVAFGAAYVIDTGGAVTIAFGEQEMSLTPIQFVVGLVIALLAAYVLLKLVGLIVAVLKFANGDETAISRYFDRNRAASGYRALLDSLTSLAAGDGKSAMAKAARAGRLLDKEEVSRLITAQAAEMNGQADKAEAAYKALLADDATRFVGVQGLMRQKLEAGDGETALKLAEKAFALKPNHSGTMETLFRLQSDAKDWAGARETLKARVRARALPRDVGKRREAVLTVANALAEKEAGKGPEARELAVKAVGQSPGLVPAATLAAALLHEATDDRKAARILKNAWSANPHPDLAAAFAALEVDETPEQRIKRFRAVLKLKPDHAESKMLEAELLIAAEDFPGARKAIGDLAETDPTTRSLAIMAAVERGMGADEAVVSGFLAKALSAPRGDAWICNSCNHIHAEWAPICENCDSFDTLDWSRAPAVEDPRAIAAATLPLMVARAPVEAEVTPPEEDAPEPLDAEIVKDDAGEETAEEALQKQSA